MKKRILLGVSALALVATPAALGLWGNASFAQSVPVRVPASVSTPSPSASIDDHGGDTPRDERVEPGDDRDGSASTSVPTPSATAEDHGGETPRDERVEPGDDRGGRDDSGGDDRSGHDDSGGDDRSGHGGGSDDHGGHGGDD